MIVPLIENEIAGLNLVSMANEITTTKYLSTAKNIPVSYFSKETNKSSVLSSDTIKLSSGFKLIVTTQYNQDVKSFHLKSNIADTEDQFEWLPSYINAPSSHCIHPRLFKWKSKVILLFASNRPSSRGL